MVTFNVGNQKVLDPECRLPLSYTQSHYHCPHPHICSPDVAHSYDSNIPLVAQELMKKMIHKFAIEYASKSDVHMTMNGLTTDNFSPQPTTAALDAPLDLTVTREEDREPVLGTAILFFACTKLHLTFLDSCLVIEM